ncbi:unnamed protein product [Pleuronectes platessa]|uniref:Uncharacterized protein n=1 Tax=Pleuronectes platessa TaxID=8262 RepID=A0A9N7UHU7_PLEPL|nr:unnamed protein product [Pleuronectes platessa]
MLEVNNVIPADSGTYSCALSKNDLEFQQKGIVTESEIEEAPVVRLKSEFHTRSLLGRKSPRTSTGSNSSRSTGAGISSLSGNNFIGRLLGRRYVYHVSRATNTNSSDATESFSNI